MLENKLGITNEVELAKEKEKITKLKALELFDDIYYFAGKIRKDNIAKGNFRFASALYLEDILGKINNIPQNTFEDIIQKYVEMNIAHSFREGNGRSTRIWLDMILKKGLNKVIDWCKVNKEKIYSSVDKLMSKPINTLNLPKSIEIARNYLFESYSNLKNGKISMSFFIN